MTGEASGLVVDPLFVALTRPPMRFGATYAALLMNLVVTMELFLLTRNLLTLLIALPVHGVAMLLCARDARIFELLLLWARTGALSVLGNRRLWGAPSVSALRVAGARTRRSAPIVVL
jgi:type IV secretion system protein VirB3